MNQRPLAPFLVSGVVLLLSLLVRARCEAQEPDTGAAADRDPGSLLAEGDRLARDRQYRQALETWARAYLGVLPQVRGLEFKTPVPADFLGKDKLREYLLGMYAKHYPDERIRADEVSFRQLGMWPAGLDLKDTMVELLTAQVAGFYDPETDRLYLVRAGDTPGRERSLLERLISPRSGFDAQEQRALLAHELAHGLADQHFDLEAGMLATIHDDDLSLAYSSLVEGEAMVIMVLDMMGLRQLDRSSALRMAASSTSRMMRFVLSLGMVAGGGATYQRSPLLLREALVFPYLKGYSFCSELTSEGSWRLVDRAYRQPPLSTEQILHPEKFLEETRDDPVALDLPGKCPLDPGRWGLVKANVLGEFGVEIWLRPRLGKYWSTRAAAGWDGDLYHVYRERGDDPDASARTLAVWVSTWDTEDDARDVAEALIQSYRLRREESGASDEPEAVTRPADLPVAESLWRSHPGPGVSGVWRRERDVWLLDGIPADRLGAVTRWALGVTRTAKTVSLEAAAE